jgi:hypothetical protein
MHRRLYPLPCESQLPDDDELLSRRDLAKLLGVAEETVKNWTRAGLLPPRVHIPPTGFLTHKPQFFWRGSDLREWAPRMIGVLFQKPPKPRGRRVEWVQGQGWVELPPAPRVPAPSPAPRPRRSSKVPGRHLAVLTRLEGQLAAFPPDPKPRPVEEPRRHSEPEPVPFASNVVRSRGRPGGYW